MAYEPEPSADDSGHGLQWRASYGYSGINLPQDVTQADAADHARVFFDGTSRQIETVEGADVPRVEIRTPDEIRTFTWRNMIGTGAMDMLTIDEPPVISVTTTTTLSGDQVNKLIDLLDQLVEPQIRR